MKAEFELTIDEKTGEPKIEFRHHDRCEQLEQKLLKIFVDRVKERGIELVCTGGYLEAGTSNSWSNYEIIIKQSAVSDSLLERAMLTLDDYLNAGDKEARRQAAENAKILYKEYYGVDYVNRTDR